MQNILIKEAKIINENQIFQADVWVKNGRIEKIAQNIQPKENYTEIVAKGKYLLPGVIDDQVHFREPGLTHKASIYTEAKAAVAGGTTSFMEMPNTVPNAVTQALLAEKYALAQQTSLANYSFFMGTTNDNLDEVLRTNPKDVCGIKIFMGSSTGNMLVDDVNVLEKIFAQAPTLIATHCEDEATIRQQSVIYKEKYGNNVLPKHHPEIRNEKACLLSSNLAKSLAQKHGTRLHILHITTAQEAESFDNSLPLKDKKITSEACVHHLWFSAEDYERLGFLIKCNPAIKARHHKEAIFQALLDNKIDVIATDHAPHTWDEKQQNYWQAPSGLPLVQHALNIMIEFYKQGKISLERIVEKMCHAPAVCFQIQERGFVREGYWADLVLVDLEQSYKVSKENLHYKCGWSPFENQVFSSKVTHTIVSGNLVYENGKFYEQYRGQRLMFER